MTNTPKPQANKTIPEILEQLWEKRGRHSKLPMYPKTESIAEATQAITQAMLDMPELQEEKLPSGDNVNGMKSIHRRKRNQLRAEIRAAIKKIGGEM